MLLRSPCGALHEDTNIPGCCKASLCHSSHMHRLSFPSSASHSRLPCSSSRQGSASAQRRQIGLHSDREFVRDTSEGPLLPVQAPPSCLMKPSDGIEWRCLLWLLLVTKA